MVIELATYEREPDAVELTAEQLNAALFGPDALAGCHVAEVSGDESGVASAAGAVGAVGVVGMALWFRNFSTWTGRTGIYLEDLYVQPEHRGRGLGRALLGALAAHAVECDYGRVEWAVLDWNSPAIDFYRAIGAEPKDEWTVYRLSGSALADAARLHEDSASAGTLR